MQDQRARSGYSQRTDVDMLTRMLLYLENRIVVDVGAAHGSFVRGALDAGAEAVYAFEPFPESAATLRGAFAHVAAVQIFEEAVGAQNEQTSLYVVVDEGGCLEDPLHVLAPFEETPSLRIADDIPVTCRTLDALVADGVVPAQVGILHVDAGRSGFAVLQGMGRLSSAVVMVTFRDEPSATHGPSAYRVAEVAGYMAERGYKNVVVIKRRDRFEMFQVNDSRTEPGDEGSMVFVRDGDFPQLSGVIFAAVAAAQQRLVEQAAFFAGESERRLSVIEGLQGLRRHEVDPSIETRFAVLEEQEQALEAYLRLNADGGMWRWVAPQLGVLYQHDPIPFHVPEHYLRTSHLEDPPLISIVTPTMNSEQFLMHTIHSIIDQGYPRLQYIVQDGASTDSTLDIVERYGSRISHVSSERDSGMAEAINRGFRHATGDIMAYLNSDDLLLPGSLDVVAMYFATHPEIDVIYGHRVIINMSSAEIGRWVLPPHDGGVLSWADYVPQETLFWRRRIWERVGASMDETFRFALDWDLLLRFREAGARFARLPRFLGAFRVHDEQKTSRELADLGASEMTRLRERHAGREVSADEIWRYLQPYMHRHKVYHKLYRLGVLRY